MQPPALSHPWKLLPPLKETAYPLINNQSQPRSPGVYSRYGIPPGPLAIQWISLLLFNLWVLLCSRVPALNPYLTTFQKPCWPCPSGRQTSFISNEAKIIGPGPVGVRPRNFLHPFPWPRPYTFCCWVETTWSCHFWWRRFVFGFCLLAFLFVWGIFCSFLWFWSNRAFLSS